MDVEVLHAGMFTTVQDLGRSHYQQYGVPVGGAMDQSALRMINMLVGNEENEAALEMTIMGPKLLIKKTTLLAIGGADMEPLLNGERIPLWRPILAEEGSMLCFGKVKSGCRTYVTFAGGIHIDRTMGSKSTYIRAAIGGIEGRMLKKGDYFQIGVQPEMANRFVQDLQKDERIKTKWAISNSVLPKYKKHPKLRVIADFEYDQFTEESKKAFFTKEYKVSNYADRMGYRVEGEILNRAVEKEILSSSVTFGTIQVPNGGQPIILMADRQTTGGYPRMGNIISVDLPLLAQLKPGDYVSFENITLEEAEQLYIEKEVNMNLLKKFIALRS
ncbi:biotin-dependent carboxyltransferase family protein [Bacillus cereus group sp. TH43LC]|uniref:Regulator of kinase autophosphorylation inhibitor n=2 Tax=Bacillus cereus group TaxID=86661 RepID=B9J591_BACCQ|nr:MULTISPECIES: biotin-dependent carboxyltransferase family protein [Bacillus cereus group]ACM13333.1 Regulator of kinase autophosphorylation inhibitor [Bacillus cereus Q1]HEQ3554202.1 biotin-dependent carboxyltransferase [Enterococcus faecalis]MBE7145451.1 biotin-dependent carboxyltransferase [Bacillus paranthracis]MBY5232262.1 KipI antagonist [Bacillus paranthracis]MCY9253158.1 biotin-dependent carboxyltransferase family protein [Bacillus paranthracis]